MDLRCPACFGPGRALSLVVEDRYRLVRCARCRSEYFRADPSLVSPARPAEEKSAYWEQYKFALYGSDDVRANYEARYTETFDVAERHLGALKSILDVGTGIGNFLVWAESSSRSAVGIDTDPGAVAAARDRGLTAYELDELDTHVPDASFDAASMWDVVEHIFEPDPAMAQMARKVRPGGALLFETPDARFPLRRVMLWTHALTRGRVNITGPMYAWEHKIYFSDEGLRRLLDRHGCDVVAILKMTSPGAKMRRMYKLFAAEGHGAVYRFLSLAFPLLEWATQKVGSGNKTILVARRRTAG